MEENTETVSKLSGGGYRYDGIDALRTFGCIAIVLWHVYANAGVTIGGFIATDILPSFNYLVYLFMMISGFGMCCGYFEKFRNRQIDLDNFYLKRYAKILPFFALLVLLDIAIEHDLSSLAEGFMELTMVFGFLPNGCLSVIGVSWTLGVIFVFYITFPFFVFLLSDKRRAWFAFAVSIVIQILCAIYFFTDRFGVSVVTPRTSFISCTPFFLAGGLIYLYREKIVSFVGKHSVVGVLVCIAATVGYYFLPKKIGDYELTDLGSLVLYSLWLVYAVAATNKVFCNRVTKFVSGISMEIYLSHMVGFRVIEKVGLISALGGGWLAYIVSSVGLLAALMLTIPFIKKFLDYLIAAVKRWFVKRKEKKKNVADQSNENAH